MGQVFRARDTKLDRDVAIKILPEAFAHDADRLARFTREAKTLASLNHPNIASIYGLEESAGITALVMELVDGDDLSERLAKGGAVEEARIQWKLLSLVGRRRPRRRIPKTLDEWSETFEIAVPRDQRDASLATRNSDQRVIKKRRLLVEQRPTFPRSNSRDNATALGKSRARGCKHTSAAFERFEYSALHIAR